MPRKGSNAGDTQAESTQPRRSTRIASRPETDAPPKPPAKPRKKRTANEDDKEEEGKTKRAKSDNGNGEGAEEEGAAEDVPMLSSIEIGDSLPTLVLKNEKEEDVQIAEIANETGVVMFLVPKADTPGCTNQACGFRDIYPDFTQYGYVVYCLSNDSPTAQAKWQTKKELPYSLISDPKRVLITALGAGEGGKTKRSHFIFEKGGKLVDKKIPVTPAESPSLALEYVKGITATASEQ